MSGKNPIACIIEEATQSLVCLNKARNMLCAQAGNICVDEMDAHDILESAYSLQLEKVRKDIQARKKRQSDLVSAALRDNKVSEMFASFGLDRESCKMAPVHPSKCVITCLKCGGTFYLKSYCTNDNLFCRNCGETEVCLLTNGNQEIPQQRTSEVFSATEEFKLTT